MWQTIGTAAVVFAGTNVDDIVILTVLFLAARAKATPRPWKIVAGQYTGIAALVAVSAVAALGLTVVPDRWVGLLGLVPFGLGVRGLLAKADDERPVASGVVSIAGVTIANGADNISVYTPLFRTAGTVASLVTVAVFAVLVALWCVTASWLGSHGRVIDLVDRWGRWLVPVIFMVIGVTILAGTLFSE
ncbi:cadmium resistance transporter [Streptosporangium sp. NPDC000239]|uniref:cadmium resistance transporter n=1 Tax=Streptosporangium sp. NPDC000239 TaxID=3154248 RepID=UPI003317A064